MKELKRFIQGRKKEAIDIWVLVEDENPLELRTALNELAQSHLGKYGAVRVQAFESEADTKWGGWIAEAVITPNRIGYSESNNPDVRRELWEASKEA